MSLTKLKDLKSILPLTICLLLYFQEVDAQFVSPPSLVSPVNGSGNLTQPVTLVWDHPSASVYHLQVAADASFNNLIADASGISDQFYVLNSLAGSTTFYWRVNASSLLFTSDWSSVWNFTTAAQQTIPSAPVLVSPANGAANVSLNPLLSWNRVSTADNYRLQVAEDAAFSNIIYDNSNLTSISQQVGQLKNATKYFWRVNARNSSGTSSWSSVWNFTTAAQQTIPSAPVLSSPANGAAGVPLDPVLSWNNISTADFYRLQVAEDSTFNNIVFDSTAITSNSQKVNALVHDTKYFWRVNAGNSSGTSSWSSVWNFTIAVKQTFPSAPVLISPVNEIVNESLYPILSWDTVSTADNYSLQVSKDEAFGYTQRAAKEEGLLVGISSGASLAAVAKKIKELPKGAKILTFTYDTGERYLSIEGLF